MRGLCLEGGAEGGIGQIGVDAAGNAAAEKDAATRQEGEGEVAGDPAERPHEDVHRAQGDLVAGIGGLGHVARALEGALGPCLRRHGPRQPQQAGPADDAFGADPPLLPLDMRPHPVVGLGDGAELHVSAFAGDRDPGAGRVDHRRGAKSRAGAENHLGSVRLCRPAADLADVVALQSRQGQRLRLEVVEHDDAFQAEPADQVQRFDHPVGIGHGNAVAGDRARHRQHRGTRHHRGVVQHRGDGGLGEAGKAGGRHRAIDPGRRVGVGDHREARIGSADVGDQHGKAKTAETGRGKGHHAWGMISGVVEVVGRPARRAERSRISAVARFSAIGML